MKKTTPDYITIYKDLVQLKFPEKIKDLEHFFQKEKLSAMEVIKINYILFGTSKEANNSRFNSYNKDDIMHILDYQKKYKLNNSQVAIHFKMSRNTISKWKKMFKF